MDTKSIPPAGDPFHAAPHHVVDPETGEKAEEYALYLCRRCEDSR